MIFTEFASFVAGKIIEVIEAMPGSVVPLAMFFKAIRHLYADYLGTVSGPFESGI